MYIDIHNHLVFGVDDGANQIEVSQRMLRTAAMERTAHIITTPHMSPGYEEFPYERYLANLAVLQKFCDSEKLNLKLHSGCEVFYTESTKQFLADGRIPTLAHSDFVLMEFNGDVRFDTLQKAAEEVCMEGYTPIFAHIERYACLRTLKRVGILRENFNVNMQVNAKTIVQCDRPLSDPWIWKLLRSGYVDYVASDAHNLSTRTVELIPCARVLIKRFDTAFKDRLLYQFPSEIIQQEETAEYTKNGSADTRTEYGAESGM